MKKIIVFGATGNIGVYFVDYCMNNLNTKEYELIAVGRKKTDYFRKKGITYINLDLCEADDFKKLPTDDVYAVVNLAGILPAYLSSYDPFRYVEVNINGALRIMEYARINNADRILYTQTWAELAGYWGKTEILAPDMPRKLLYTGDHAFYSITKSMIVDTLEHYKQEYGIKNFVFRLPNVYLYNPQKEYYVDGISRKIAYRYMIDTVANGHDIEMWGNPDAFKDILYVKDLCQMMYRALFAPVNGGTYNAGTGIKTTLREQIEGIVKVFSPSEKQVKIIEKPELPGFVSFVMDIENAKSDLGYRPEYMYLDYLRDYKREMESKKFDELWLR